MKTDTALILLGGAIVLGVGFFALRPSRSSAANAGEPGRGAGGTNVGLNIGGTKGFTLKVPESTANRLFGAAKVAF